MAEKKIIIIINPNAGLLNPFGVGANELKYHARSILPWAEIVETRSETDARDVVQRGLSEGVEIFAGAGGDGTAHFLAGILQGGHAALALIPQGSAGNVGRSLDLPGSVRGALRAIKRGKSRLIDLGSVNGAHFIEAAGVGFHAGVLREYGSREGKSLVQSAYAVGRAVSEQRLFDATLEMDGSTIETTALQITVSNTPYYGAGFRIAPRARTSDGLLDVTIIRKTPDSGPLGLAAAARLGVFHLLPGVETFRTKSIRIVTERPMPVHADADAPCDTPAEFTIRHKTLRIIVS